MHRHLHRPFGLVSPSPFWAQSFFSVWFVGFTTILKRRSKTFRSAKWKGTEQGKSGRNSFLSSDYFFFLFTRIKVSHLVRLGFILAEFWPVFCQNSAETGWISFRYQPIAAGLCQKPGENWRKTGQNAVGKLCLVSTKFGFPILMRVCTKHCGLTNTFSNPGQNMQLLSYVNVISKVSTPQDCLSWHFISIYTYKSRC